MPLLSHLYVGNSLKKFRNLWNYALIIQGQLFATLWTVAWQAPLSIEFPRQEYWSGLPFSPSRGSSWPRDQNWVSCVSCLTGEFFTTGSPGKPYCYSLTEVEGKRVNCVHQDKVGSIVIVAVKTAHTLAMNDLICRDIKKRQMISQETSS